MCVVVDRYNTSFWREAGFSGEVVATSGIIAMVFDGTTEVGVFNTNHA